MIDFKDEISVIVLTYNEEKHIERCLISLRTISNNIFIVDSFSKDKTVSIAERLGAKVFQNPWENYAKQLNWGIKNLPIKTQWIMRVDCDEYLTDELSLEIKQKITSIPENINGLFIKRRVLFMGKWIKHGGYYPFNMLRIWRKDKGFCEELWMDEHIKLKDGKTMNLTHDFIDSNLNNLTWWTEKHNNYSLREMFDLLNLKYNFSNQNILEPKFFGTQDQRNRWLKYRFSNLPLFIRPLLYFIYRYIIKMGFLDGAKGLIWHFLQGFWYRFLVDAKIFELYNKVGKEKKDVKKFLKEEYKVNFYD